MGSPRNTLNRDRIARNRKHKGSWKKRKGGISQDAWKDLSKKEKKEMKEAGMMQPRWREGHFGESGQMKFDKKQRLWEAAAWEMGMGNVKDSDQLRELFKAYKDKDFNNFNSMNDVKAFDKTSKENIDKAIEDGINSRWEEFMKERGEGGEMTTGQEHVPQRVDGADEWESGYGDVIKQLLDRIGGQQQGAGNMYGYGNQSPWIGANRWTPQGGW